MNNILSEKIYNGYSTSTNIAEIKYDDDTFELDITFQNGAVYRYFYFPNYEFDRFITSDSHGQFFNNYIKNDYEYEKLVNWN